MNHIYRLVWSAVRQRCIVAPESARGGHGGNSLPSRVKSLCVALLVAFAEVVGALPVDGVVVGGSGAISQNAKTLTVNQATPKLAVNWQQFNIAAGEAVNFVQPGRGAIALNRVLGAEASAIYGQLTANGQVFLVNSNGILFGRGAQVNVGGLVASTLDLSVAEFMAGSRTFSGSGGRIDNLGNLSAAEGGYIALLGGQVSNRGTVSAQLGTVALAAGNRVSLDFAGDKLLSLQVEQSALDALVENSQLIAADGGQVILTTRAAGEVLSGVVNNSGIVQAKGISSENGVIRLSGDQVVNSGTLDASGAAAGGSIGVFGREISLRGARLDVSGQTGGGSVLIGGDVQGKPVTDAGNPVASAQVVTVDSASVISADARSQGNGGKVVLWSEGSTQFDGSISARGGAAGGDGGFVETSGHILGVSGKVDVGAAAGHGGTWLLDPYNVTIQATGADTNSGTSPNFGATGSGAIVTTGSIQAALASGDVQVTTGSSGGENGDITVASPISWSSNRKLTLSAARNIDVNATISASGDSAGLVLTPGGAGAYMLKNGERINLTGATPSLTIAGKSYEVINSHDAGGGLGEKGSITKTDLQGMRGDLTRNYALGSDIDASATSGWDSGGFVPVGPGYGVFYEGFFDGLGHTVSGLTINRPAGEFVGLFGVLGPTAQISNVGLVGGSVSGGYSVGGLAGKNLGAKINNAYNTGSVTGTMYVGGLVGFNQDGAISDSYASGDVGPGSSGIESFGGLVGYQSGGSITRSYASGDVSAGTGRYVGGLVGTSATTVTVTDVHATGSVSGGSIVGGLVGNASTTTITRAYASGPVTAIGNYAGGLIGDNSGTVSYAYASGPVSAGGNSVGGLVGSNSGNVSLAYATGTVSGADMVGGLVGSNGGTNAAITTTYATGAVTDTGTVSPNVGGLVGYSSKAVTKSFWNTQTSGQPASAGGGGWSARPPWI